MFDIDNYKRYGSLILVLMSFVLIAVSGIFFGVTHYMLETTEVAFQSNDCVINDNSLVSSCQELWDLALYPFLGLRSVMVWLSYFFIFALTIGLLVLGYQSGRSPAMLGLLVLMLILFTYLGIEVSNIYRTLISNDIFRTIMVDFAVYNRIMLNFAWFVFIVGLFSVMLSIVNYQKIKVNTPTDDLDY